MEAFTKVVWINVQIRTVMIEILSVFADFDYRAQGVKLKDLGMEGT